MGPDRVATSSPKSPGTSQLRLRPVTAASSVPTPGARRAPGMDLAAKADEPLGPAAHGLQDHFVVPPPEPLLAPGEAQKPPRLHPLLSKALSIPFRPYHFGLRGLVKETEGRFMVPQKNPLAAAYRFHQGRYGIARLDHLVTCYSMNRDKRIN